MVVLRNSDSAILAEAGGRRIYKGHNTTYSDFNRVTQSLRQPGSAMKPIVYLAAFRQGALDLDTPVPDEPISVASSGNHPLEVDRPISMVNSRASSQPGRRWRSRETQWPFGLFNRSESILS